MKRLLFLLLLAGCATTDYTPQSVCNGSGAITVFDSEPKTDYKVCGSIDASASVFLSDEDMITAIKKEATKYGANAVILVDKPKKEFDVMAASPFTAKALAIQIKR